MIKEKHPKEAGTVKALMEIKNVLDKHGLKFWLDFGTLLGAVRDKKILPWDVDIDLSLVKNEGEFSSVMAAFEELTGKGFDVSYFWEKGVIILRKQGSLFTTIHFFEMDDDKSDYFRFRTRHYGPKALRFV